jgi:hypothetical protein
MSNWSNIHTPIYNIQQVKSTFAYFYFLEYIIERLILLIENSKKRKGEKERERKEKILNN